MLKIFIVILPWRLKRFLLQSVYGYKLHPTARIGLAWVFPGMLIMEEKTEIHHFTVAIHLDTIHLGQGSTVGRSNWITGLSSKTTLPFFTHQKDRKAELVLGRESHISKHHHIDCTNSIIMGDLVTIAGSHSQFLTHSIDIYENRQHSNPITIGDYSFVGTNVVMLGGSALPARSVLGAKSLLNKAYTDEWMLYAGVPAKPVSEIARTAKYFFRERGFVN